MLDIRQNAAVMYGKTVLIQGQILVAHRNPYLLRQSNIRYTKHIVFDR